MKNSRKIDSPKRSIIDKPKKRLVHSDSHDNENSDVLVSAVISPYLLTHLHHILQHGVVCRPSMRWLFRSGLAIEAFLHGVHTTHNFPQGGDVCKVCKVYIVGIVHITLVIANVYNMPLKFSRLYENTGY